ncbi:hypothetical protein ACSQ67_026127 [Phaseolus vulgaris]
MRELPEQQASLGYLVDSAQAEGTHVDAPGGGEAVTTDQVRREPHGSVGATAGHRAIAQSNSAEIAEALFRYTAPEEVMTFPSTCGACAASCETRMFVTNIPYFQEVIVMASTCDACGYRNSELKPGGRIPEKGKIITLSVKNVNDLSRDVIKSDTASVKVPEVDLELASGTLGGIVTTVEGLERVHGFTFGDSLDENSRSKWIDFKARLNKEDMLSRFVPLSTPHFEKFSKKEMDDKENRVHGILTKCIVTRRVTLSNKDLWSYSMLLLGYIMPL